jgi:uncharacterized repeat protein (TIGR01451 family)/LPXTG-motif cell wall-anchored protein
VTPEIAGPGDEVIFTIEVSNQGNEKAVGAYVFDDIPEHLEVEDVVITPADQGMWEKTNSSQQVVVSLGTIGRDLGVVRIEIHARVRQDAPPKLCVENLAEFRAHNCPDRSAVIICTPPETGGTTPWWMVAGGLGVCVLVLGLALSKRERA